MLRLLVAAPFLIPTWRRSPIPAFRTLMTVHGFAHPLGGLDHVLAMVAVGLLAAQLGGRALWFVPAAFVVTMAVMAGASV